MSHWPLFIVFLYDSVTLRPIGANRWNCAHLEVEIKPSELQDQLESSHCFTHLQSSVLVLIWKMFDLGYWMNCVSVTCTTLDTTAASITCGSTPFTLHLHFVRGCHGGRLRKHTYATCI